MNGFRAGSQSNTSSSDYYAKYPNPSGAAGAASAYGDFTPRSMAASLPSPRSHFRLAFENVKDRSPARDWEHSAAFQNFRGEAGMQEPCKTCDRASLDFGGWPLPCIASRGRCRRTDPVFCLAPLRPKVDAILAAAHLAPVSCSGGLAPPANEPVTRLPAATGQTLLEAPPPAPAAGASLRETVNKASPSKTSIPNAHRPPCRRACIALLSARNQATLRGCIPVIIVAYEAAITPAAQFIRYAIWNQAVVRRRPVETFLQILTISSTAAMPENAIPRTPSRPIPQVMDVPRSLAPVPCNPSRGKCATLIT